MKRLVLALKVNRTLLQLIVFDAAEGHGLQALLDHSCGRNRRDAVHPARDPTRDLTRDSVPVTQAQLVERLAWDAALVRGWLEKLQLPSVIPIFAHYGVDGERLLSLGLQDLRNMQAPSQPRSGTPGVLLLGRGGWGSWGSWGGWGGWMRGS